ncbi:winged helix-turn-helix domain-containing protein [Vibrio hepatarius]|uniref:winged helix-turn-helix domain-containing protein n=1 Tax=Vibrio hepatarius TaxID=171383 RepID=UPI00142DA075|nr:transcriptional regulator [Vibrio hepatarius]NIY84467.1 transcriptional regulator [Vibrio hepatarius]
MSNIGTKFNLANRFTFDPNTNSLVDKENDNETTHLGSNESRILTLLCENPGAIVSRNELHDFVWRQQGFEVDDSSLTQAISTLRKLLQDSTKSPQFVKTVPKRGYQLIASVERTVPLMSGEAVVEEPIEEQDAALLTPEESSYVESVLEPEVTPAETESAPVAPVINEKTDKKWPPRVLILLALLLPLCVILFTTPSESRFREVGVYDNTPVLTPTNHPDLSRWTKSIEQCVKRYNETHTGELAPVEVIATGGQNNNLVLNYIHSLEHSGENITFKIYASQEDLSKVCK